MLYLDRKYFEQRGKDKSIKSIGYRREVVDHPTCTNAMLRAFTSAIWRVTQIPQIGAYLDLSSKEMTSFLAPSMRTVSFLSALWEYGCSLSTTTLVARGVAIFFRSAGPVQPLQRRD